MSLRNACSVCYTHILRVVGSVAEDKWIRFVDAGIHQLQSSKFARCPSLVCTDTMKSSDIQPAAAPEAAPDTSSIKPEVQWHRAELIGFIVLATLPILAVFGAFGPTLDEGHVDADGVRIAVEYPARMRFHTVEHLVVRVRNNGSVPLTGVHISFSSTYIQGFTDVVFTPDVEQAYSVALEHVLPNQSALMSVQLKADEYGWHSGDVSITHNGQQLSVPIKTFIFP